MKEQIFAIGIGIILQTLMILSKLLEWVDLAWWEVFIPTILFGGLGAIFGVIILIGNSIERRSKK